MSNVLRLPNIEQTSAELSSQLHQTWEGFKMPYEGSTVITNPLFQDYDPIIRPNGVLQLGMFGINDFEQRLAGCEVDVPQLYVSYMSVRHAIEHNRTHSPVFHEALVAISAAAKNRFPNRAKIHDIERRLIGFYAARIAMEKVTSTVDKSHSRHQQHKILQIQSMFERKSSITTSSTSSAQKIRAALDFRFGISGANANDILSELRGATITMLKNA